MEKLSEEERERIEKEAQNWWHTSPIITSEFGRIDAYKQGATAECLKKNEEIESLKEQIEHHAGLSLKNLNGVREHQAKLQALETDRENRIARELTLEDKLQDLKEFIENNKFNNAELTVLLSEEKSKLQASEERIIALEEKIEDLRNQIYYH